VTVLTTAGTPAPDTELEKQMPKCGDDDPDIPRLTGRNFLVTLKPGESTSQTLAITDYSDMTQPGRYTVQVRRRFHAVGRVYSKRITVEITP
jgi:hypothetical protein